MTYVTMSKNPYVGPRAFTESNQTTFFGREAEARDLISLVVSEQLVIFSAQSGAGKSSLINARLIPSMRERGFHTLPSGRLAGEPAESSTAIENIFTFNLLRSIDLRQRSVESLAQMSIHEFLQSEKEYVAAEGESEQVSTVLVIDQFEEIVTTHLKHWQARSQFFTQLNDALTQNDLLWILLVLREDYVPEIEPYARLLSGRLQARFYMPRMERQAALMAIKEPAKLGERPFADGAAELLADNLRQLQSQQGVTQEVWGQFVEPVQLQVVCFQLWQALETQPLAPITKDNITALGNVDAALSAFYEQTIATALLGSDVTELQLRNWCEEKLITSSHTRGTVHAGSQAFIAGVPTTIIKRLEDLYLLRAERRGGLWYELVHDRFIEPILQANQQWRLGQAPLLRDADMWQRNGRLLTHLYKGQRLADALESTPLAQAQPLIKAFLEASANEEARQKLEEDQEKARAAKTSARRFRTLFLGVGLISSVVLIALAYAFFSGAKAAASQLTAENARKNAIIQQGTSEAASILVAQEQGTAEAALPIAQSEQSTAEARSQQALNQQSTAEAISNAAATAVVQAEATSQYAETLQTVAEDNQAQTAEELAAAVDAQEDAERVRRLQVIDTLGRDIERAATANNTELAVLLTLETARLSEEETSEPYPLAESLRPLFAHSYFNHTVNRAPSTVRSSGTSINTNDGNWRVWNENGTVVVKLIARDVSIELIDLQTRTLRMALSPDNEQIAIASGTDIYLMEMPPLNPERTIGNYTTDLPPFAKLSGHQENIVALEFSTDGQRLISSSPKTALEWYLHAPVLAYGENEVNTTSARQNDTTYETIFLEGGTKTAVSADGQLLVVIQPDDPNFQRENNILIWPLAKIVGEESIAPTLFAELEASKGDDPILLSDQIRHIETVALSPDGKWLAVAIAKFQSPGTIYLWSMDNLSDEPIQLESHRRPLQTLTFSPNGRYLLSGGGDGSISNVSDNGLRVWDMENLESEPIITPQFEDSLSFITFSPDEQNVVILDEGGHVHFYPWADFPNSAPVQMDMDNNVTDISFSPDGELMAVADDLGYVHLRNLANPSRPPDTLGERSGAGYTIITFSPDGSTMAMAGENSTIYLWKTTDWFAPPLEMNGNYSAITDLRFTPNGNHLISTSADTVRVWPMPQELETTACALAQRNLTEIEWFTYFDEEPYHKTCPNNP